MTSSCTSVESAVRPASKTEGHHRIQCCLLPVYEGEKHGYIRCDGRLAVPCQYAHASAFRGGHAVVTTCFTDGESCDTVLVEVLGMDGRPVSAFPFHNYPMKVHDTGDGWQHLNVYDGFSLIVIGRGRVPEALLFRDYGGTGELPALHWNRDSTHVMSVDGYDDAAQAVCAYRRLPISALNGKADSTYHQAYAACAANPGPEERTPPVPQHIQQAYKQATRLGTDRYIVGDSLNLHIINGKGRTVSRRTFDEVGAALQWAGSYLTIVYYNGKAGLLDGRGRLAVPCEYSHFVKHRDNDLAYSHRKDAQSGLSLQGWVTEQGKAVPAEFDIVRNAGAGLVCAKRDGRAAYFTWDGKQVTTFSFRFFYDTDRVQCSRAVYAELIGDTAGSTVPMYISTRGKVIYQFRPPFD